MLSTLSFLSFLPYKSLLVIKVSVFYFTCFISLYNMPWIMFISYYFNFLNLVVVFCLIIHMPLTDWVTDFFQLLLLFVYFLVSTCHFFSLTDMATRMPFSTRGIAEWQLWEYFGSGLPEFQTYFTLVIMGNWTIPCLRIDKIFILISLGYKD